MAELEDFKIFGQVYLKLRWPAQEAKLCCSNECALRQFEAPATLHCVSSVNMSHIRTLPMTAGLPSLLEQPSVAAGAP